MYRRRRICISVLPNARTDRVRFPPISSALFILRNASASFSRLSSMFLSCTVGLALPNPTEVATTPLADRSGFAAATGAIGGLLFSGAGAAGVGVACVDGATGAAPFIPWLVRTVLLSSTAVSVSDGAPPRSPRRTLCRRSIDGRLQVLSVPDGIRTQGTAELWLAKHTGLRHALSSTRETPLRIFDSILSTPSAEDCRQGKGQLRKTAAGTELNATHYCVFAKDSQVPGPASSIDAHGLLYNQPQMFVFCMGRYSGVPSSFKTDKAGI